MSTKVDGENVTYKNGNLIMRSMNTFRCNLDLTNLPDDIGERQIEVIKRIYATHHVQTPETKYFTDWTLGAVARLADAIIKEAGL